jgi:hypothetical protein
MPSGTPTALLTQSDRSIADSAGPQSLASRFVVGGVTALALLGTLAVPLVDAQRVLLPAAAAMLLVGLLLWRRGGRGRSHPAAGPVRLSAELVLHLSPVALLTVVFPIASERISTVQIDGVGLGAVLLASSLTVPWLSQAVCLPLYRGIGGLEDAGTHALRARFVAVWPLVLLRSAPVLVVFAVPVQLVMDWPVTALGAYLLLALLHLAFAQSLVLTTAGRSRVSWAVSWAAYAVALLAAPTLWVLPPLVGLLTQLVVLRRQLPQALRLIALDRRDVLADLLRGLLLGSVLWADKLLFFLTAGTAFAVDTVFLALLPAVLAYNVYFVVLAPSFDRTVKDLRRAMEEDPLDRLDGASRSVVGAVVSTLARTGLAGAVLSFVVTAVIAVLRPDAVELTAAVSVASWFFLMTTVLCYKLDYIGQRLPAQLLSAAHLVACVAAFLLLPIGAPVYLGLIAAELVIFFVALRTCLQHWRQSEYTFFWRHATAW